MNDKTKIKFLLATLKELVEAWDHIESGSTNRIHHGKLAINTAIQNYIKFVQEQLHSD